MIADMLVVNARTDRGKRLETIAEQYF